MSDIKEKIRCFAAYWGAKVKVASYEFEYDMCMLNSTSICVGQNKLDVDMWYKLSDCALLLKPLSDISDEHAIEVAKMFSWFNYYGDIELEVYDNIFGKKVVTNKKRIGKYESVCLDFDNLELLNAHQIDYLRSESYNIGYAQYSPSDLVAKGWVIETKNETI